MRRHADVRGRPSCNLSDPRRAEPSARGIAPPIPHIADPLSRWSSADSYTPRALCRWGGLRDEPDGFPAKPQRFCFPCPTHEATPPETAAHGRESEKPASRLREGLPGAPRAWVRPGRSRKKEKVCAEKSQLQHRATLRATSGAEASSDSRGPRSSYLVDNDGRRHHRRSGSLRHRPANPWRQISTVRESCEIPARASGWRSLHRNPWPHLAADLLRNSVRFQPTR